MTEAAMIDLEISATVPLEQRDVQLWHTAYWAEIERRIGPLFARPETRSHALSYLSGLLSPAERKNSWQLAEICGQSSPYAFQHLLGRADWNPDALRDRLQTYVTDYLTAPDAVGVIDETGFLKKGSHSAGVARQYSGTAGKVENCQIGVFLVYASERGQTLLDRELYLPKAWTNDRERCRRAGIPDERAFATKPALAQQMLARAFAAGVLFAWVTGDSIYGDDRTLRSYLEGRNQAYVLAVSLNQTVWLNQEQRQIKTILAEVPSDGWQRLSAGLGSKGPRTYDWWRVEVSAPAQPGWKRWLLFRRSISDPNKVAAYLACGPADSSLVRLVRVAGMRWTVEESIQTSKGEVGLDHYEVRSWTGWYRHISLAMWAHAWLSVIRAEQGAEQAPKKGLVKPAGPSSLARFKAHRNLRSD
jgi:SRSO17 transposase